MIINVKRSTDLSKIKQNIVLGTSFGVRQDVFSNSEIKNIYSNNKYSTYINFDKILHENELEEAYACLSELSFVDGVYFSDFAVYEMAKKLNIVDKLIYNSGTLITNIFDVEFLVELGLKRICLSRELTLEEIKFITNHQSEVEVLIHGKINMFYSRRPLLTNYFNYKDINGKNTLYLEEETRDSKYLIIEDENGTHIFNEGVLNSYDELRELNCYYRIDGFTLTDEELLEEINIYERILSGESVKVSKDGKNDGFYYKETKEVKE